MSTTGQPTGQALRQRGGEDNGALSWLKPMLMYFLMMQIFGTFMANQGGKGGKSSPEANVVFRANFNDSEAFDLRVFITEAQEPIFENFLETSDALKWKEEGLTFDWDEANVRGINLTLDATESIQNNGSVYAHVFVSRSGAPYLPHAEGYSEKDAFHRTCKLNRHAPKLKVDKRKNLFAKEDGSETSQDATSKAENMEAESETIISYWEPSLDIRLVVDRTVFSNSSVPPPVLPHLKVHNASRTYYPIVYFDRFWTLKSKLTPINATVDSLPLSLKYHPISLFKWQMQMQMEESWEKQRANGLGGEGDSDELKRMMMETNPYLLALTAVVSVLHMVFDCLAFKSDIQFWREKRSMEGLSVRSMGLNAFCQIIVFLYLLDNDTSWMIILSSGVGILIEFWKLQKALDIKRLDTFPYVSVSGKSEYTETETAKHDRVAMTYLSYVLYPLVAAYAVYSLVYEKHKSFYSWILGSLVGSVYMFGFIMMCPQLYLNYKLKSVAHLPWRMLTYKALNTFIDDMFAFIIKMPTLHRLSCFRDDVIFFIYLYQRWIYPVDYSRVNEFGLVPKEKEEDNTMEEKEEGEEEKNKKENVQVKEDMSEKSDIPKSDDLEPADPKPDVSAAAKGNSAATKSSNPETASMEPKTEASVESPQTKDSVESKENQGLRKRHVRKSNDEGWVRID